MYIIYNFTLFSHRKLKLVIELLSILATLDSTYKYRGHIKEIAKRKPWRQPICFEEENTSDVVLIFEHSFKFIFYVIIKYLGQEFVPTFERSTQSTFNSNKI